MQAGDSQGKNQRWLQNPTSAQTNVTAHHGRRKHVVSVSPLFQVSDECVIVEYKWDAC